MTLRLPFQWLLLVLIVLGVFYPAIFGGLSPVDDVRLVNRLANLESLDFTRLFLRSGGYYYRPVVSSSFYLSQILWDASALIMHVENVLIHLLNSSLVFALARRLCRNATHLPNWLPLLIAVAFALHPITTEAVCWISGRFDLLATTFVLLSVCLLLWALSGTGTWRLLPAVAVALLGCLSKETALFFFGGAVFILYVHWRNTTGNPVAALRRMLPGCLLWCGAALAYLLFRQAALSGRDTGVKTVFKAAAEQQGVLDWLDQLRVVVKVSGFYVKKLFVPYPLNFAIIEISDLYLLVGFFVVLLCGWLLRRVWQGHLSAALFWGGLFTGSAALLVVFGRMAWTLLAERYLYMPAVFFVLGWCAWAGTCQNRRFIDVFQIATFCFVLVGAGLTVQRTLLWGDRIALLENTVTHSPKFVPARKDLANQYLAMGRIEEGKALLREIMLTSVAGGGYVGDDLSLAKRLGAEGRLEEAHKILVTALEEPGKQFMALAEEIISLNHKRLGMGLPEEAKIAVLRENVRLLEQLRQRSKDPFLDYQLAKEYLSLGEMEKAQTLFESAYLRASETSHYREAARKLSERLRKPN
ncbi:hypothetical protein [Sulfuriflexus sp.]|uniref:hypothetical protein n=1 Tax=Sulfuriflexus sp. TaxID=2015443 RepID=UPI0028CE0460|nr:hypothetical protein [Sulfuriflexus sp.]MDT8405410.1 hypothetical protein [Sulfuriflexus sp.]